MARTKVPISVVDTAGNAISGALVRVKRRADGSDRTLYAGETGGTTVANPMTTDAFGRVSGWVDRGAHTATVSGAGITTYVEPFDSSPFSGVPTFVTALPSSPADGDVIYYEASAGVLWQFRYRAASTSAYKWEFVGGPPSRAQVTGPLAYNQSASANTLIAVPSGPSRTLPLAGDWEIEWSLTGSVSVACADWRVGAIVGGIAGTPVTPGSLGPIVSSYAANAFQNIAYKGRLDSLAASQAVSLFSRCNNANLPTSLYDLSLAITPCRVG